MKYSEEGFAALPVRVRRSGLMETPTENASQMKARHLDSRFCAANRCVPSETGKATTGVLHTQRKKPRQTAEMRLRAFQANQRAQVFLAATLAFTLLYACGAERSVTVRPTPTSTQSAALSFPTGETGESRRSLERLVVVRDDSRAAVGMVHGERQEDAAAWQGQALTVVGLLGLTVFAVIVGVVGRKLYRSRRDKGTGQQQQGLSMRSRLFSRDRLNTTDYMHTLATLDRKLAMDEILEKRRRAVFLQQIRCHTQGDEDDVFLEEVLFCPEPSERLSPNNIDSPTASGACRL